MGLGNAFKVIAKRNMMRGNRGAAEAVNNYGIEGFRSNMKESREDVKIGIANASTQTILRKDFSAKKANTSLGANILDSVN